MQNVSSFIFSLHITTLQHLQHGCSIVGLNIRKPMSISTASFCPLPSEMHSTYKTIFKWNKVTRIDFESVKLLKLPKTSDFWP